MLNDFSTFRLDRTPHKLDNDTNWYVKDENCPGTFPNEGEIA